MADDGDEKPYKVGYGKPPPHSRFKAGQSGNPKGRPKGAKAKTSFQDVLDQELERRVRVKVDGEDVTMSARDAVARRLIQQALQGKPWANRLVINLQSEREASLRAEANAPKVGVVVVRRPSTSVEEWLADYGGQRLPLDPLEGLPGITPELRKQLGRRKPPEDDC